MRINMKNIIPTLALIILVLVNLCATSSMKFDDQTLKQGVESNEDELGNMWPSFTDDSYIYLLGLFVKQRVSISRHFSAVAELAMFRTAFLLSQKYNITANGKQFAYRIEQTSGRDVIETIDRTCLSIAENQVPGIVGPEYSSEAKLLSLFANRVGLPVIGYSITDPELSDRNAYQTLYRLPPSDFIAAHALLRLFQKYKWNSTNVIYQSDSYGQGGLRAIRETFGNEIKISRAIKYDLSTDQIDQFQRQLEESPSRIVLVWANANVTSQIIQLALQAGNILAPFFQWILVPSNMAMQITDNRNVDQLSGILMLRLVTPNLFHPSTNTELLREATAIWKEHEPQSYPTDDRQIDIFALYAFDAAWLLILSIQKLCQQNPSNCLSFENSSSCFASHLVNGQELNQIIQAMNFTGVSGHVQFQPDTTDRLGNTIAHYVIDNLQPDVTDRNRLQVTEVLRLNGTNMSTNHEGAPQWTESGPTIRWVRESSKPPSGYALLEDRTLNITVYESAPFFMLTRDANNNTQPSGYIPDLVEVLQKLMKFNYNFIVAPRHYSYDELVECVQNHTYEIVMADLSMSSSRTEIIDFSYPIFDNTLRLVVRKNTKTAISPFAFFQPFTFQLWLMITFLIYICSALLVTVYELHGQQTNQVELNGRDRIRILITSFGNYLYHFIGALLQRGSEVQPGTFFGRFQTVIVWLMSIILVALLTSNLTVYFNAQYAKPWLQSIEDLRMCHKVSCNRIGVLEGSQHEEYFNKEIMNGAQMNYHHLKRLEECYTKLLDHRIDVAIADSSSADYFTQTPGYCQLEMVGLPFSKTYYGIAMPKEWRYKDDLNKNIMELKVNGEIDRLLEKWFQQKTCDHENEHANNGLSNGLTILETSGLFYIFVGLTVSNIILFGLTFLYHLCVKKYSGRYAMTPTAARKANQDDAGIQLREMRAPGQKNEVRVVIEP